MMVILRAGRKALRAPLRMAVWLPLARMLIWLAMAGVDEPVRRSKHWVRLTSQVTDSFVRGCQAWLIIVTWFQIVMRSMESSYVCG